MRNGINKLARLFSVHALQLAILQIWLASSALAEGGAQSAAPAVPAVPGTPAGSAAAAPAAPSMWVTLMPFLLMFAVMYLLILRPQKIKMQQHQDMLSKLVEGDEVVTTSGIFGKVKSLTDKVVTLEVADKVCLRVVRGQVAQKVSSESKS